MARWTPLLTVYSSLFFSYLSCLPSFSYRFKFKFALLFIRLVFKLFFLSCVIPAFDSSLQSSSITLLIPDCLSYLYVVLYL